MLLFLFVADSDVQYALTIWAIWRVSDEGHELLILREHLGWPPVSCGVRLPHLFSFLCCVVFFLCLFSSCVLCIQCCQCVWLPPFFFLTFIWKGTWRGFICSHCGSHLLTFYHKNIFLWNSVVHIFHNYSKLICLKYFKMITFVNSSVYNYSYISVFLFATFSPRNKFLVIWYYVGTIRSPVRVTRMASMYV